MQDGMERGCFLEALRYLLLVIPCSFERFCLQHAAKEGMQKSQKYFRKTDERGPQMVPTPRQNRSWRGSGGLLGATLETRCFQDRMFDDFGSSLGPPLGSVLIHVGHHVFDAFFF